MKLLEKHEVDQLKARERKQEIDEGAKLAKKIDELRRLEADEKSRITSWRDSSLELVKGEIAEAFKERDTLRSEIQELKKVKERLLLPLDAEWEKVHAEQHALDSLKSELQEKEEKLALLEKDIATKSRSIEVEEVRVENLRNFALQKRTESEAVLTRAKEDVAQMRNNAQTILIEAELTEKLLTEREERVAEKEAVIDNKMKESEAYAKKLHIKQLQLKDLEETLIATKKELDAYTERSS